MKSYFFAALMLLATATCIAQPNEQLPERIELGGNGDALFCYDFQSTVALIYLPGVSWPLTGTAGVFGLYYPQAVETVQGCIVSDIDVNNEPEWWAYFVGDAVEIHLPIYNAVYVSGNEADLLLTPKPLCHQMLTQQHEMNIGVRTKYDIK